MSRVRIKVAAPCDSAGLLTPALGPPPFLGDASIRISISLFSILVSVSVTMPTSLGVQPARYSEADLAIWSLAQWIAFLDGKRSRPEPAGPSVVEYSQPSHGRDQLELGHPRSFSRWREMSGAPVGNRTRLIILYPSAHSTETDPYWLGMTALVGQSCCIECLKRGRIADWQVSASAAWRHWGRKRNDSS